MTKPGNSNPGRSKDGSQSSRLGSQLINGTKTGGQVKLGAALMSTPLAKTYLRSEIHQQVGGRRQSERPSDRNRRLLTDQAITDF